LIKFIRARNRLPFSPLWLGWGGEKGLGVEGWGPTPQPRFIENLPLTG
jgi:hypothetical protein